MQAVRLHGRGDLRSEEIAKLPSPAPFEVKVRVAYAGICGSDLHNFKTGQWITRTPSIAGHEMSGWIDAVGPNVTGLKVGDIVAVDSRYNCGECKPQASKHSSK